MMCFIRRVRQSSIVLLFSWTGASADGYEFGVLYTGEVISNVSGGIATGSRYLDNLDLTLDVDVAEAWGFGSGRFFAYGLYNNGARFSDELAGDLQVASNIDTGHAWRIYEFWYEFGDERWSVRTGLYDLNSEFDTNDVSDLFLNSSHGIGPDISQTGKNGPSIFPITSMSIRGALTFENVGIRVAALDGVPGNPDDPSSSRVRFGGDDGALLIAEVDANIGARGRIWSGIWRYTGGFERLTAPGLSNDNHGWYVGVENEFDFAGRTMSGFLRYGQANEQLNPVKDYIGAGLVIAAPFAGRPDDELGFAVASARVGRPYRDTVELLDEDPEQHETTWELSYRATITDRLVLQPDVQFIHKPSARAAIDDALVVGLRFEIAY